MGRSKYSLDDMPEEMKTIVDVMWSHGLQLNANPSERLDILQALIMCQKRRGYPRKERTKLLNMCDEICAKETLAPPFSAAHCAVLKADAEYAGELLELNPQVVHVQDIKGETPLHLAARNADLAIIEKLVRAGSDVSAYAKSGDTPLSLAVQSGQLPAVAYFLSLRSRTGRRIDYFPEAGLHPLMVMVRAVMYPSILSALVQYCNEIKRSVPSKDLLCEVAKTGRAGAVDVLVGAGLGIRGLSLEADGSTPLHHAAKAANCEVMKALLQHGAEVDSRDREGKTPLHWAVCCDGASSSSSWDKATKAVKFLTERGADSRAKDAEGRTPAAIVEANKANSPDGAACVAVVLNGAPAEESWRHRRGLLLYRKMFIAKRLEKEELLRDLLTNLCKLGEKGLFEMVIGYL